MSMRQPVRRQKAKVKRQKVRTLRAEGVRLRSATGAPPTFAFCLFTFAFTSVFDICHLTWPEAAEELGRALAVELRVRGLDQHEEAVARGEREVRRVEDRVVRLGQPVQGEHAEDGEERRAEHSHLERDGYERGPAVGGLAADVQRVVDDEYVVLHQVAERAAEQAPYEHYQRHRRAVDADGL